MTPPVQMVTTAVPVLAAEEMIEPHFPGMRGRGIGGDVAANTIEIFVGSGDDHHGIPSDDVVQASFQIQITGISALVIGVNGVEVGGVHKINVHATFPGSGRSGLAPTLHFQPI